MLDAHAKFLNPETGKWEDFGKLKFIEIDKAAAGVRAGMKELQDIEGWPEPPRFQIVDSVNRESVFYDSIKQRK